MTITRMIAIASIAGLIAAAPLGFAHGASEQNHSHGASAGKAKLKVVMKKKPAQHRHMHVSGMKRSMMQAGQAGQMGHARKMQCPMMSGNAALSPMHSPAMRWHHSMMMWHHKMMHSGG